MSDDLLSCLCCIEILYAQWFRTNTDVENVWAWETKQGSNRTVLGVREVRVMKILIEVPFGTTHIINLKPTLMIGFSACFNPFVRVHPNAMCHCRAFLCI